MKKAIYTIVTLCIGVVIGMTSTVTASPVQDYVQASIQRIKFIVNGEEKKLDADPLVYQGSTYLPVRTVLNALGYDVGYKADSKTVTADKSVETILSEANAAMQKEGNAMESNDQTTNDGSKIIDDLNHSITREKETIETIELMIQNTQGRTDVSEESKKQKIEEYKARIERSQNAIESYEAKLSELKKKLNIFQKMLTNESI
ncbi:copper amine oxidase N-terminal domain-containing protein [Paenibacillus sp. D2_2]|uniref:copper amine oxidase N-terminal domain-containing protein n=1 Tax=Paenibacillus sp. D2_2 TaxID=3073092 RepID=UPI002814C856|nr:copper amine oxidase N-terminal domain-containing protein [Paenibacillus sp. D2_2]WMT42855.1 copper amine oxidase N-terminal domain-containing protein [Paenibacillus sp. D2_2]